MEIAKMGKDFNLDNIKKLQDKITKAFPFKPTGLVVTKKDYKKYREVFESNGFVPVEE